VELRQLRRVLGALSVRGYDDHAEGGGVQSTSEDVRYHSHSLTERCLIDLSTVDRRKGVA